MRRQAALRPARREGEPSRRAGRCRRPPLTVAAFAALAIVLTACGDLAARATGPEVPDFALVVYQGDRVFGGHEARFANIFTQGKPVVLNFWAGRCPPCQAEMPAFGRVAAQYEGRVIVVGIDVGAFTGLGTHDQGRELLADLGIRYPAAYAVDASPLKLYNVRGMPTTIFLTARGRVVERVDGVLTEDQLRAAVGRLVAARP